MVLLGVGQVVRAFEWLHDPKVVGNMQTAEYLSLCLQAGYSKDEAERAARDWGFARLQRGLDL